MNLVKAFRTKSRIKLSGLISGFTLIILFSWTIFPASAAGIEASREISGGTVNPGESFVVAVHISTDQDIEALVLDENLPDGWQVSQWENNGAAFQETSTFKASTLERIWVEKLSAGEEKIVIYNVTVPSNSEPGNFTLLGRVSAYSVPATPVEGVSEVIVTSPPPEANFSATPLEGLAPLIVQFTDLSTFNPDSWGWDFDGNGNIDSNERNPVYNYENPGIYTVILKTTNNTYGNSTQTKAGYITVTEEASNSGGTGGSGESSEGSGGSSGGSGGSSGGSGGGAGSPESTSNVELKEISNEQVFKGIHTCFTFKGEANEIVSVEFDPKKNFGKTTAIVEMLKNTSSIVKEPAPGTVYRNVNL
jgi:PKD repeat protein